MDKQQLKKLFFEVCRYLLVGGTAFIVNYGVTILFEDFVIPKEYKYSVLIAAAIGFAAGLTFNYIFSILFVFKDVKDKKKGKSVIAFIVFAVIGVIGLALTELGMFIFSVQMKFDYKIVLPLVSGAVLLWNYIARKILIFR